MMLRDRNENLVALRNICLPPAESDKVKALGSIACENDLLGACCADEFSNALTGVFIGICCLDAQLVKSSERICVFLIVVLYSSVDDPFWLLLRGGIVEIDKSFVFFKDREVFFSQQFVIHLHYLFRVCYLCVPESAHRR